MPVLDEFEKERRLAAVDADQQHRTPGSGQGDVEEPAFFGMQEGVARRHGQCQQGVVFDLAGESAGHHAGDDDIVGFQPLRAVDRAEPDAQMGPIVVQDVLDIAADTTVGRG